MLLDRILHDRFGFTKLEENPHAVVYERTDPVYQFRQIVCIHRKNDGHHLIQSYDKNRMDAQRVGNVSVGLEIKELIPFWLKAKWMIRKYKWNQKKKETKVWVIK